MDGVLNVLKPTGMTSHDVVDVIRRLVGQRRVGHTGTLDPGAAGVLVLVLGQATRVAEFLSEADKSYRFELTFGMATTTGDAFGEITSIADASSLSEEQLADVLPQFLGEIEQLPPMTSAVKVGGVPLYRRARRGETVAVQPRRVRVYRLRLLRFWPGRRPRALLDVECGKGTYVRALARDIGQVVGVGAYASFMLRLRVGAFPLEASRTLEELSGLQAEGRLGEALVSMDDALADLPAVQLLPAQRLSVQAGLPLPLFRVPNWQRLPRDVPIRLRDRSGLIALARVEGGSLRPFKVLRGR